MHAPTWAQRYSVTKALSESTQPNRVPLEELEAAVNSAVVSALSNRTLVYKGAAQVRDVFERIPGARFGLVQPTTPRCTAAAADVPGVARGDRFEDESEDFRVVGIETDGAGLVLLSLESM